MTTPDSKDDLAGRYTIAGALGSGASGDTFEAVDLRDGSRVALKRLALAATKDWKAVELFEREARVLAGLRHPAIPRLHDSFVVESAQGPISYLAHELAPGRSLQALVEGGWRPDENEVVRIGCFLLDVLAYLHALTPAVIHRDIKPSNIIRSDDGRMWLVDFGAVRDTAKPPTGGSTVVGTYGYMAPEQFRGHAVPESDLYGVAATLLYLLTSRPPTELPQEKLKVAFRSHVRISDKLAAWLDRALEPAPEDRFPSALAALAALRGETTSHVANPARSRATLVALLSILGVVVIGGVAFMVHEARGKAVASQAQVLAKPPPLLPPRPPSSFQILRKPRMLERAPHAAQISAMAGSKGTKFVTGTEGSARVWDWERGKIEQVLAHDGVVRGLAFTGDERLVISAGGGTVRFWNAKTGAAVGTIALPGVIALSLTSDDKHVVAAGEDGVLRIYDVANQSLVRSFRTGSPIETLASTPDGRVVAAGGRDGIVELWSKEDGRKLAAWPLHRSSVIALAFAPDGRSLATAGEDHAAHLVHLENGMPRGETQSWTHDDRVYGVTFSPDGNNVFTTGREGAIKITSAADGHLVAMSRDRNGYDMSKAHPFFSKDGSVLLVVAGPSMVMRFGVSRHGSGTKIPEPVPEKPGASPPLDHDHELYVEATRLIGDSPRVPLEDGEAKVRAMLASTPRSPLAWIANAYLELTRANRGRGEADPAALALARTHLDHAASLGPKGPEWWSIAAQLSTAEKKPDEAREAVRQLAILEPGSPRTVLLQASLDLADERFEKVAASVSELVRTKPLGHRLDGAYSMLATAYTELGDIDAADAAHRRLIDLQPKDAWLHGNYSYFLLVAAGDTRRSIEEAHAALAIMDYGVARGNLANALTERADLTLWSLGSIEEAIRDYDEAIRAHSGAVAAYYGRAAAYRRKAIERHDPKSVALARSDLKKVMAISPRWGNAPAVLAELDAVEIVASAKR